MKNSGYLLFLDDARTLSMVSTFGWPDKFLNNPSFIKTAKSTKEALSIIDEIGFPEFMELDHDLGTDENNKEDTTMLFLKELFNKWDPETWDIPDYAIHSDNPVGKQNIISFMASWRKSYGL